ncbi:MAG: S8 family serine peptidase, partial [Phycisphaerae bacterium]
QACPGDDSCDDPFCCAITCGIDPFCCLGTWDAICVGVAQEFCANGEGVCANPFAGPCLNSHFGPGCGNQDCCTAVCEILPTCCDEVWDDLCAELASTTCDFAGGDTPDFEPNQGYRTIASYSAECPPIPPPGVVGSGNGFDLQGLWDFGEFLIDLGVDSENLTRGKTMRIGIIEHSAWVTHEDLDNKVIPEPGQTIIHFEGALISSNHGTATLGITVAEDNGIGVTGIAPEAQGYFFPIVSLEEGGRTLNAIASALLVFEHGDVLSFSFGPAGCGTLASGQSAWTMLRMASDLGITCCISAGNDCCNLDEDDDDGAALGDSGAIVVGAGFPGAPFCRLGFSNHSDCDTGRVHCQAWGTGVATTGYGDLFNPGAEFPEQGDPNRSYTQTFGGTSSAAPMIAAITANLQGISKMFFGIPLMPEQIRGVVSGNGFFQCGAPCIPQVLCGQVDGFECFGDGDCDEDPNAIGLFPEVVTAAEALIAGTWFDGSPLIDDIDVLRGTLLFGNKFSIKASDNNRLAIKSQFTGTMANIDLGIIYLAAGQITDLLITANSDIENVASMTIVHEAHASDADLVCPPPISGTALVFYEMYDWNFNRWSFVAFDNLAGADPPELGCPIPPFNTYPVNGPTRFVRAGDGRILLRIWTLSLGLTFGGFGGAHNPPYVVRHDWIDIQVGGGGPGDIVIPP